jgi:hypothetical protein
MSTAIDVDLWRYFDTIRHSVLLDKIAQRIQDLRSFRLFTHSSAANSDFIERDPASRLPSISLGIPGPKLENNRVIFGNSFTV